MNCDQIAGNLKQLKGHVLQHYGRICNNAIAAASGRKAQLLGRIQNLRAASRQQLKIDLRRWGRMNNNLQHGITRPS